MPPKHAAAPPQPKSARHIIWFSLTFVGGLVLGLAVARAAGADGTAASRTPTTVATVVTTEAAANVKAPEPSTVTKTVTPPPPKGISDGTYTVPGEVKPGKYKTKGSDTDGIPCYWARLSGTSGDFNEILANGNPVGQTTITIKSGDKAFETNGCQDWVRVK